VAELQEPLLQLLGLPALHAALGLVVAGVVMLLLADWRLCLLALAGQYLLVGLLLSHELLPQVALVKVLVGGMVCVVLYVTAVRISWGAAIRIETSSSRRSRLAPPLPPRIIVWDVFPVGLPFRLFMILLGLAVSYGLSRGYPLPGLTPSLNFAFYWLLLLGFLLMAVCHEPFRVGLGLFTLGAGFELFYVLHERSLLIMGLLGTINLAAALAISYLMIVEALVLEESGKKRTP
jgi:hypothetical protein